MYFYIQDTYVAGALLIRPRSKVARRPRPGPVTLTQAGGEGYSYYAGRRGPPYATCTTAHAFLPYPSHHGCAYKLTLYLLGTSWNERPRLCESEFHTHIAQDTYQLHILLYYAIELSTVSADFVIEWTQTVFIRNQIRKK